MQQIRNVKGHTPDDTITHWFLGKRNKKTLKRGVDSKCHSKKIKNSGLLPLMISKDSSLFRFIES